MDYVHPDLYKRMNDRRRKEAEGQAESWRLLRQARAGRSRWLPRPGCWLLRQLGHMLVKVGRWLQAYASPQQAIRNNGTL